MKHVQIRLDDGLSDWLDANFGHGFKQSFGEACFSRLRQMAEEKTGAIMTTSQMAELTVAEVVVDAAGYKQS
jgi:hypothetical protein